ncbi:MAG: putative Histidine kinase [Promethearchaeota archaeon]|nr:MAG: putative Histidine kinase [Candidatus Lokiarchaeota archaeon]
MSDEDKISSESLRRIIDEFFNPCSLWKKKNGDYIFVNHNSKIDNKFPHLLENITKNGILVENDDYKSFIYNLKRAFDSKSTFTMNIKSPEFEHLVPYKFCFIPPNFVMVINKSKDLQRETSEERRDEDLGVRQIEERDSNRYKSDLSKRIKSAKERYKLIFNMVPDLILINDTKGNIKYANKAVMDSLGIHLEELKQMNLAQIFHRNNKEEVERKVRATRWGEAIFGLEVRLTDYQGNKRIYEVNAVPFREEGKPRQIINIARDITNRKKMEQELRESREMFETIAEQSLMTMIIIQDDEIKYRNAHFGKFAGFDPEKAKSFTFRDIVQMIHPEDRDFMLKQYQKKIQGESDVKPNYQFRAYNKEGEIIWLEIFSKTITFNNRPADFITLINITEKKKAKKQLDKAKRKYQSAYNRSNFFKDLFVHDINNIIQSIQSSSELIDLQKKDKNNEEEIFELNQIIKSQTLRAKKLIDNIQKLNKVEEANIPLKKVNLNAVLNEAINFVSESYQKDHITITVDSFSENIQILANDFLLDVFENILINGIKHNENEEIKISVRILEKRRYEKDFVRLEFADNGVGIKDENKKLIFKKSPFKYKSSSGLGLGLTLVKKILELYGGKIWVEDRVKGDPSKGSRFIIEIPKEI